jgi:hypothetical protein
VLKITMNISILHGGHSEISHGRGDPEEFVLEAIKSRF